MSGPSSSAVPVAGNSEEEAAAAGGVVASTTTVVAVDKSEEDAKPEADPPAMEKSVVVPVTILLQSGARHQFGIDRKYLERHAVKGEMTKENLVNPFDMTVWQLKECVWKDWKEGKLAGERDGWFWLICL